MSEDVPGFLDRAKHLAETIRTAGSVAIVSHIDADGISSAAIAKRALDRLKVPHRLQFVKSLGEEEKTAISKIPEEVIWLCDLGGGSCERMRGLRCVITDHHQIISGGQSRLDLFGDMDHMLNPLLFGMNGATHLSGAGNTYFVARELDRQNQDLAYLAIVGAVGDMQDRSSRKLAGPLHSMVIDDAKSTGTLQVVTDDLPFFGWVTRSAAAMLAFSNDLKAIGYDDSIKEVSSLFYRAGVPLKRTGASPTRREGDPRAIWRSWSELDQPERNIMKATLRDRLAEKGLDQQALDKMLGETYLFVEHPALSPTREAKEFATLLNASGRYILTLDGQGDEERGDLIINVCLNPKVYSESALANVDSHKVNIREGVKEVHKVEQMVNIQYLLPNRKNSYCLKVSDTILGIITGMVLDQKKGDIDLSVDPEKPLVALTEVEESAESGKDPVVKVSTRMNRELTKKGINLGKAVNQAALRAHGDGGGHDVAAGANIPKKQIKKFLAALDEEVGAQLSRLNPSNRP
ncbi:MAG: DHH family phosphoesterase [Methanomassiliicoccales archaeon]|nr:DHH family phosphoesterase [Methanomassiliicoccales archaeon]